MSTTPRMFHPRNVAVPTPLPQGGTGHLLVMDGQELKKLAKKIVLFEYLRDKKDRYVFNPEGKPVPKIEQDDEALIAEAMKKCRRITNIAIPVYIAGEQQFEETDEGRVPRVVVVSVDAATNVCASHDEPIEGRCIRCSAIVVGDLVTTASQMFRDILSETVQVEVDVTVEPPGANNDSSPAGDGTESAKVTIKRPVDQLLAEWIVERCVELGRAKKAEETKN
ncbi:MAG: hypothetical protein ACTHQM_23805 [Thermoanaerobaculia bacterium]